MTHYVKHWSMIEMKESAREVAERLVEELAQHSYRVKCLTDGFRAEFNGIPVLELPTGEHRKGKPFYHSTETYEVMEYAVIAKNDNGQVYLGDYYGPAGVRWSGKARSTLESLFTGSEVEGGEEVEREASLMQTGPVYCGTFTL